MPVPKKKLASPTSRKRTVGIGRVPKINLTVNGIKIRALVDSGSSLTIVKAQTADELVRRGSIIEPCEKVIKTLTDSGRKIKSKIRIRVSTLEGEAEGYAYVLHTNSFPGELLLGSDIMEPLRATIDYQRKGVVIAGKLHRFINKAVDAEKTLAISEKPITEFAGRVPVETRLHPGTATIVQLQTHASLEGHTVVVMPYPKYDGAAAGTLCVVKDHCVHLLYANLDDRPLTLREGTKMARIHRLYEEEDDEAVLMCNGSEETRDHPDQQSDKEAAIALQIDNVDVSNLSPDDGDKLKLLLWKYKSTITASETDIGHLVDYEHHISVTDETPINVKQWRLPFAHKQMLEEYVSKMVKAGIIQESTSP